MKEGRGFGRRRSTDGKGSTICRLNQSLRQTGKEEKLSLQGPHGGNTANILNKPCALSPLPALLCYEDFFQHFLIVDMLVFLVFSLLCWRPAYPLPLGDGGCGE